MFAYCENNPVNRSDPNGDYFVGGALYGMAYYYATKCIIAVAGNSYLSSKEYELSREMFNHGMHGRGEKLPSSTNDLIVNKLKESDIMGEAISSIMKSANGNSINVNGDVEFKRTNRTNADLYYSLQHVNFNVRGTKSNGVWNLTVTVTDTYNFDNLRIISEGLNFGNAANDLGWMMQKVGMMTPYDVSVSYQLKWG